MTKWYRACVNYIHSVPEYNCAPEQERFTEKAAIAAIHKLKRYYDEKHFVKDPDYMVRMDRLLSVKTGRSCGRFCLICCSCLPGF